MSVVSEHGVQLDLDQLFIAELMHRIQLVWFPRHGTSVLGTLRIFFATRRARSPIPETTKPRLRRAGAGRRRSDRGEVAPRLGAELVIERVALGAGEVALLRRLAVRACDVRLVLGERLERAVPGACGAEQGGRGLPEVADVLHDVLLARRGLIARLEDLRQEGIELGVGERLREQSLRLGLEDVGVLEAHLKSLTGVVDAPRGGRGVADREAVLRAPERGGDGVPAHRADGREADLEAARS